MNTQKNIEGINYAHWKKIISIVQLSLALLIFITEVVTNILLYATRSQGYGPDTIVSKLLRYLVLTSAINFGSYFICKIITAKNDNEKLEKYTLIITTVVICTNVVFSHYQFSICFGVAGIPILLCMFYEDKKLCNWAAGLGAIGLLSGVIARGLDSEYNTDIGPVAAISFVLLITIFIVSRICIQVLSERNNELNEALVASERARYLIQVEQMSIQMLTALVQILDAKDSYTNGHSFRVSEYAVKLARALGYSEKEIETVKQEALLHDIGKIGIPDSVLNKPGKLSNIEFNVMKSHTSVGSEILQNMISLPNATLVANSHHERYDGSGYPLGLKGEDIPAHARIVAIADAYDAMSSDRIYRKALSKEMIREQLVLGRGKQFDPNYLDKFLILLDKDDLNVPKSQNNITDADRALDKFLEDIKNIFKRNGRNNDFTINSIDKYAKEIKEKSKLNFAVALLTLNVRSKGEVRDDELEKAISAMDLAIRKNIRSTDIYTSYSKLQSIVVLKRINPENVTIIIDRILLDFYKLVSDDKFELEFEVGKYQGELHE